MPNRDPEKAKQAKRRWYLKHKEEIAKQKREQRAAQKKLKPPKPPKPPRPRNRLREPERRTGWFVTDTEPRIWPKCVR